MKVIHESLLARFRLPGRCEYCGKPCQDGRDPAHIFSRGAGRIDIAENLVSLCRWCHNSNHLGNSPTKGNLLTIAARREGTTPEEIEAKVMRLRASKLCKLWNVDTDKEPE